MNNCERTYLYSWLQCCSISFTHLQWFGNLVTPDWWSVVFLSEAFAQYYYSDAANYTCPQQDKYAVSFFSFLYCYRWCRKCSSVIYGNNWPQGPLFVENLWEVPRNFSHDIFGALKEHICGHPVTNLGKFCFCSVVQNVRMSRWLSNLTELLEHLGGQKSWNAEAYCCSN